MRQNLFWNSALTASATIGIVMLISHIFEQYAVAISGSMSLIVIAALEMLITFGIFLALLFFATRRYAKATMEAMTDVKYFTFRQGALYVMTVCTLIGVIIGLGNYIYIHNIVGYDTYIKSSVKSINMMVSLSHDPNASAAVAQAIKKLATAEEPGLFSTIIGHVSNYMAFVGLPLGVIYGLILRRKPDLGQSNSTTTDNE